MINPQRLSAIHQAALSCRKRLSRYGRIKLNDLPKVSFEEDKWLRAQGYSKMMPYTRTFTYSSLDYKEDANRPASSRLPVVREVWVGARSLACVSGESELPEGLSGSQLDQEDAAELTDIQTALYENAKAFGHWLAKGIAEMRKQGIGPARAKKFLMSQVAHDRYGNPVMAMIEDESGLRPIRNGDIITTAHGSNEDLDALFLEEPSDDRSTHDSMLRELTRDQVRANSGFEEMMIYSNSCKIPNNALGENRWNPDEITLWRIAHSMAEKVIERYESRNETAPSYRKLSDQAFVKLRAMANDVKFDEEGAMIGGYFVARDEFFGTMEQNLMTTEATLRKPKARPAPVDWSRVRGLESPRAS